MLCGVFASGYGAAEVRTRGADGSNVLVGRAPDPPYERPPLSKEYLRGEASREDAYVNPVSWYEENGVELRTGTNVMSLDPEARTVKLQGGDEVEFEKALIATGANVNILRVDGANLDRIRYLRTFGNSDNIRADAEKADRVVLVGGSYIACEVAASLKSKGTDCALVMMEDVALSRTFGDQAGRWFQELLESKGIEFHGGQTLAAFEGDYHASAVVTESGTQTKALFHAMSTDGRSFSPRARIPTEGQPNHPQLAVAPDGALIAVWDESGGGLRRIARGRGAVDAAGRVSFTRTALGSDSGTYPKLVATPNGWLTAWTSGQSGASVIRLARLP